MTTVPAAPPTILESFHPSAPPQPDRLSFDAYRELVLQREAARAAQQRAAS
jgi:hypothetical protein